jgi:hypothetical protein
MMIRNLIIQLEFHGIQTTVLILLNMQHFYQILYYPLIYIYDIMLNPVKVVGNKSSIVACLLVGHSSSFASNKKKERYPKPKIDLKKKLLPLYQYRYMFPIERNVLIK